MNECPMKILIIRFSSFGDVLQCLSVAGRLKEQFPQAEIHWVTRADFRELVENHPAVTRTWVFSRKQNFKDLVALARQLRNEKYTHIYDAHNNLRSHVLTAVMNGFLGWRRWRHRFLRRPIYRFRRFLLFRFRINRFPKPFSGQGALLAPLKKWRVESELPPPPQLFLSAQAIRSMESKTEGFTKAPFVALAASAAYPLKRWPLEHFKTLIRQMPGERFALLGGPEDRFLEELAEVAPDRVRNFAGRLNLMESAAVVGKSQVLVSNDTGLMHVAEQLGRPCVALMGPAPFGFPSRLSTTILQLDLKCRPCSKHGQGPCVNPEYQKCLKDITPETVKKNMERWLHAKTSDSLLSQ